MALDQKQQLGAFLRTHRERLRAVDVGLRESRDGRRRTPGLRREEVAQLCGMSPTWYTWIEQGRDISVSPTALARLADALRMTRAERAYLFELTRKQDPAMPVQQADPELPPGLRDVLGAVTVPAYCLDRLWRACGWNAPAAHLFTEWLGGAEPCLLRYVFLDPSARHFIADWDERARRLVAEFRADTSRYPGDPALGTLIEDLRRNSRNFALRWDDHDVLAREGGLRLFNHPQDGLLRYEQVTLRPAGHEEFKMVLLLPAARSA
jgi:transcriptional regulator with XRE-family HTH domain